MRKADREIKDFNEIVALLGRCDTLHIGMTGENGPYVVPVSFGFEVVNGQIVVYFHGAKEGRKHDLLAKDPRVCVEASLMHGYRGTGNSVTADYESILGFGTAKICSDKEAAHGVTLLMEHCGYPNFDGSTCIAPGITRVYRIKLASVTGKRRFAP